MGCWSKLLIVLAVGLASVMAPAAQIHWKLPKYTLVARDLDLRVALDSFAVAEGLSVVMSDYVAGSFSGNFKDVDP